jgi:hypothetical protein
MMRIFDGLTALGLMLLSGEILLRRWAWGQVPTQVSALSVYAFLAADLVVAAWLARAAFKAGGANPPPASSLASDGRRARREKRKKVEPLMGPVL